MGFMDFATTIRKILPAAEHSSITVRPMNVLVKSVANDLDSFLQETPMKKAFVKGLVLLEEFRKVDPDMPLQMAATFLVVANNEGVTMKELGDKLGISQSSCSRNVAALSKVHRLNKPGHDLLYAI